MNLNRKIEAPSWARADRQNNYSSRVGERTRKKSDGTVGKKTLSVVIFHLVIFIKIGEVGGGSGSLLQSVHEALLITKETISEEDLSDPK
jgi:hypothetical protein